jgi:hypothetical protein
MDNSLKGVLIPGRLLTYPITKAVEGAAKLLGEDIKRTIAGTDLEQLMQSEDGRWETLAYLERALSDGRYKWFSAPTPRRFLGMAALFEVVGHIAYGIKHLAAVDIIPYSQRTPADIEYVENMSPGVYLREGIELDNRMLDWAIENDATLIGAVGAAGILYLANFFFWTNGMAEREERGFIERGRELIMRDTIDALLGMDKYESSLAHFSLHIVDKYPRDVGQEERARRKALLDAIFPSFGDWQRRCYQDYVTASPTQVSREADAISAILRLERKEVENALTAVREVCRHASSSYHARKAIYGNPWMVREQLLHLTRARLHHPKGRSGIMSVPMEFNKPKKLPLMPAIIAGVLGVAGYFIYDHMASMPNGPAPTINIHDVIDYYTINHVYDELRATFLLLLDMPFKL